MNVSQGSWCRYCDCMPSCPAYTALARSMLDLDKLRGLTMALTPEERGIAWRKAKQVLGLAEMITDSLKELARQEMIPLPDGKVLREIAFDQDKFIIQAALDMLKDKGATDEEIATLYKTVRMTPVKEVLHPDAPRGRGKKRILPPKQETGT